MISTSIMYRHLHQGHQLELTEFYMDVVQGLFSNRGTVTIRTYMFRLNLQTFMINNKKLGLS